MERIDYEGESPLKHVKLMSSNESSIDTFDVGATELLILVLDVSQGECTILIERNRSDYKPLWCCIIDGGYGVAGRGAIARYLKEFAVTKVDAMICTHFDGDHTRGLTEFLIEHAVEDFQEIEIADGRAQVMRLFVRNKDPEQSKSSTKLKLLEAAGTCVKEIIQVERGPLELGATRTKLRCIHTDDRPLQDENEGSIALLIQFDGFSYYTAGDLPTSRELTILDEIKTVDAFKCGHHGSANSTPPDLLQRCKPMVALISAGRNSFGHPTYDVIERLGDVTSPIVAFYLTNCIHNRRLINRDYVDDEVALRQEYIHLLEKGFIDFDLAELERPLHVYDLDKIAHRCSLVDQRLLDCKDEQERTDLTHHRRIFRALHRAAEHEAKTGLKNEIIGHAGGSPSDLGTILLHIPADQGSGSAVFHVGLVECTSGKHGARFVWNRHQRDRATEPLDLAHGAYPFGGDLQDVQLRSCRVLSSSPSDVDRHDDPERPSDTKKAKMEAHDEAPPHGMVLSAIPSSPRKYEPHLVIRCDDYRRFNVPTIIGLTQRTGESVFVPFCGLCRCDPDPGESKDFELLHVVVDQQPYQLHRLCFFELFTRLGMQRIDDDNEVPLTRDDARDLDEVEVCDPDDVYDFGMQNWMAWCHSRFRDAAGQRLMLTVFDFEETFARMQPPKKRPESDDESSSFG